MPEAKYGNDPPVIWWLTLLILIDICLNWATVSLFSVNSFDRLSFTEKKFGHPFSGLQSVNTFRTHHTIQVSLEGACPAPDDVM